MAASDYGITVGFTSAYISRINKRNTHVMSADRRVIDEGEIQMLVDWWADRDTDKDSVGFAFNSHLRPDCRLELRYVKKEGKEAKDGSK